MKCENHNEEGFETFCRVCMENDGIIALKVLCIACIDENIKDAKEILNFKEKHNKGE